ncbi:MAG TPA: Bax inhibitor-1/YccA family protein [Pseudoflavonifractor sp.]|nr:Bax inhibitor-1/YccA family protein [Pseudoflavonifractor sp.]
MEFNENQTFSDGGYQGQYVPAESVGVYTAKTFLWMFAGLLVTFLTAIGLVASGLIVAVFSIPSVLLVLFVAEVAVVLVLSARINKMSVGAARALFFTYAVLNGIVFSVYLLYYDVFSLILVFGATALYFGGMALFGWVTKADLSRIRNILVGGLIFLIVFGLLSMFIPALGAFERILCLVGIAVFLAFTAYDTQKIKAYYAAYQGDDLMLKKASIFSALQLYLDFINLFLYLLRFLGRRRS